jgi:hypothetical protein
VRKIAYYALVACAAPCLLLAVPVAVFEVVLMGTGGRVGQALARPFLWACDRARER